MPLVTETGAGLADAESYCSVDYADTYHEKRRNTSWAALSDDNKEANLRKATDYMLGEYRGRWLGRRVLTTQALDWPRVGVVIEDFIGGAGVAPYGLFQVDYTIVPVEVKNACAELALRAAFGTLTEDLSKTIVEEAVGPIRVKYDKNSVQHTRYRQVDSMLSVYLTGGSAMVKLSRT